jgi:hypothetical protein
MTIEPYRIGNMQFAFDDPVTGLVREPFIGNANYHLDKFAGKRNNCSIAFSSTPIPDYDVKLELLDTHIIMGSNYKDEEDRTVWLCPALFKYFKDAPQYLYIKNTTLIEGGEEFIKGEIS